MIVIVIVLLIVLGLLWSEYSAKARYVKQLEDAIDIAHSATGFLHRLRQVAIIYTSANAGEHPIDFESVSELLGAIANEGIYHQIYSGIPALNDLWQYLDFGLIDYDRLQDVLKKVGDGGIGEPDSLHEWYKLVRKHSKVTRLGS
jgi:hypothetical protein